MALLTIFAIMIHQTPQSLKNDKPVNKKPDPAPNDEVKNKNGDGIWKKKKKKKKNSSQYLWWEKLEDMAEELRRNFTENSSLNPPGNDALGLWLRGRSSDRSYLSLFVRVNLFDSSSLRFWFLLPVPLFLQKSALRFIIVRRNWP